MRPAILLFLFSTCCLAQPTSRPANPQAELEQKFAEMLGGSTLVGRFTFTGKEGLPQEERYTISSARKLFGEKWLITARIQYGKKNESVAVPVPVTIKWAGDTPILQITDLDIPGMGTFTARVLFYDGQYAGTWSGGDHGGQMFGRIEKAKPATQPAK